MPPAEAIAKRFAAKGGTMQRTVGCTAAPFTAENRPFPAQRVRELARVSILRS
jgi:hypothetical protein